MSKRHPRTGKRLPGSGYPLSRDQHTYLFDVREQVTAILGNAALSKHYRQQRGAGMSVRNALNYARAMAARLNRPWVDDDWRYGGLVVKVEMEQDTDAGVDGGKWCDDKAGWHGHMRGEYVKNPNCTGWRERGLQYLWFRLECAMSDHMVELRKMKFGKALSHELAWSYIKQDAERAAENNKVGIWVRLFRTEDDDTAIAEVSLWGIDDEEYAQSEVVWELLPEALEQAKANGWVVPKTHLKLGARALIMDED